MVNTELLTKVLQHIKANPTEWDQLRWSACVAGWTLRLGAGAKLQHVDFCDCSGAMCVDLVLDGQRLAPHEVPEKAAELLGLPPGIENELFLSSNTLPDVERIVRDLTAATVAA